MKKIISRLLYSSLFIFIGTWLFTSCEPEEFLTPQFVNKVSIEIGLNTIDKNIFITEIHSLGQQGFIILGLCNNDQMNSKFEGDGSLYIMKIDKDGLYQWDTCFSRTDRGFPSKSILSSDSEITLIWNSFEFNKPLEILTLSFDNNPEISNSVKQDLDEAGEIFDILVNFQNDGYYLIGAQSDALNNHFISIIEVDKAFKFKRLLTRRYFEPEKLGGFGLNDIDFLERLSSHVKVYKSFGITPDLNKLLFTGPQDSVMTISHVGEIIPDYSDEIYWTKSLINIDKDNHMYSLIISDSENSNGRIYFAREIVFSGPPDDYQSGDFIRGGIELDLLNKDSEILMMNLSYDPKTYIIGGSTRAGQLRLFRINDYEIRRSTLGQQNPLQLTGMIEMLNGGIIMTGHMLIANELQKPFIIIINPKEI